MKFTFVENLFIALAVFVFGIMAGFFWTYTFNVNLAMLAVDGATYATVQSLLNQNVRHLMFFAFFFGGGAVPIIALAVNWRHWKSLSFLLLAVACVVYIGGIIIFTRQVNLPLNYYTESWEPQNLPADWAAIRAQWNQANAFRVGAAGLSFALGLGALVNPSRNK
ncbi:MAG: DUF1772 domain-containing protein [Caldilineaceae bacterium]|nr:DUF1772 domain-containing protein [Caldilineaceae bacterium]